MKVKFFTAGGTIDKVYFDAKSEYEVGPPQVVEILKEAHVTLEFAVETVLSKDSLDMTAPPAAYRGRSLRANYRHARHRYHGADRLDLARHPRQDHRADGFDAAGPFQGDRRRIQYWHGDRRCGEPANRGLHRHERPHLRLAP